MKEYKQCTRFVMDNRSDDTISFDNNGYCNYCTTALNQSITTYFPNEEGKSKLNALIDRLKSENKNNKYDCIMGISGGLDSSYLAYLGSEVWGLRILALHIDDGFDTAISKRNIKKLCEKATIDLINIQPDAKQFNELTRAHMLAGVPNLAVPQDNVLFACIYKYMRENKIRTFLSGGNYALECILQKGNTADAYDTRNIKDIFRKFGRGEINKLPLISNWKRFYDMYVNKIESPRPLDFIEYNRECALNELKEFCDFEYYGSKHLENTLTKFIQVYWFYHKFNVDKRTSHLSSMIISNQMTRETALKLLKEPLYDKDEMNREISYILEILDISSEQFDSIMSQTPRQHDYYKTSRYKFFRSIVKTVLKQ